MHTPSEFVKMAEEAALRYLNHLDPEEKADALNRLSVRMQFLAQQTGAHDPSTMNPNP